MFSDLRFACRRLARHPGFTAVAVLTLALGIGLNTSMFSVLNLLLLRPLPFPEGGRLVRLFVTTPEARSGAMTTPEARVFETAAADAGYESLGVFGWWGANLTEPGRPAELLVSLRASAGFLPTLGVEPLLGRWFTAEEQRTGAPVILISHGLWQRVYSADPDILGRSIQVDREPVTVIGVMPPESSAPIVFGVLDFWRPLVPTAQEAEDRANRWLHAIARTPAGMAAARAEGVAADIARRMAHERAWGDEHMGLRAAPLHASGTDEATRTISLLTLGLTGFVLLIACANLASLHLARAARRTRELAVRSALGASRARLMRPLVLESLMLAAAGGAAGLVIAVQTNTWIARHLVFNNGSAGHEVPLDHRVLLFAAGSALVAGLLAGCLPGWLSTRVHPGAALRDGGRGATAGRGHLRLRRALVGFEFALALILLTGALLMLGGLARFLERDAGWAHDRLAFGYVPLQTPRYQASDAAVVEFYERMCEALARLPGVEGVAFGWDVPLAQGNDPRPIAVEGRPAAAGREPVAGHTGVLPGYFEGLGIARVAGRDFTRRDTAGTPRVAIVNEHLARAIVPDGDAVGRRIRGVTTDGSEPEWMEIVGVVRDVGQIAGLGAPATRHHVYVPFAQEPWRWGAVALRTRGAPEGLVEPMRRVVAGLDGDVPVWSARTVREEVDRRLANPRLTATLLAGVALLGLFLAALGIHSVMTQNVAMRAAEIGVRIALGADAAAVHRLVLAGGLGPACWGIAAGGAGAAALAVVLRRAVPGLPAVPPVWLAALVLLLLAVALLALWLPARRAVRIDPVVALRGE